tara:strand:+ start:664 stop:2064 length:1401 start_codon:yes stop_codon:yes gene_type:complete
MGLLNASQRYYYEGADGIQNSGDENYGNYQFISLTDIINQFIIAYIGEDKIISRARRTDVAFHAMRAMQELSYDTFKSCKAFEYTVPPTLKMPVPQDFVNQVKVSWVDDSGITRLIYPALKTSNPAAYQQNSDGTFKLETNSYIRKAAGGNNPIGTDPEGQTIFSPTIPVSNEYEEYGITATGKTSNKSGSGDVKSNKLLPKFTKETRVSITNTSGYNDKELSYGPGSGMQINFYNSHDIEVGMTIFGPGIPKNSTVKTVGDSTSGNYPGMGITFTNPVYEQWLLDGSVGTNPGRPIDTQIAGEEVIFVDLNKQSDTWKNYKSHTARTTTQTYDDYEDDIYWPNEGTRYGIDPQHGQINGSYFIDCVSGYIHFSSNISGKNVVLEYISDSLGTDEEMIVHKLAEEAVYKYIAHAILASRANTQEYLVRRFQKDKFAAIRKAKLRLSNIKIEELSQILRGKSKHIKH